MWGKVFLFCLKIHTQREMVYSISKTEQHRSDRSWLHTRHNAVKKLQEVKNETIRLQVLWWTAVVFQCRVNRQGAWNIVNHCIRSDAPRRFPEHKNRQSYHRAKRKVYWMGEQAVRKEKVIDWNIRNIWNGTPSKIISLYRMKSFVWIFPMVKSLSMHICSTVRTEKLFSVIQAIKP